MDGIQILKDALRHPYAWPGGYEKAIYLSDGERICHGCARENFRQIAETTRAVSRGGYPPGDPGWGLLGVDVYWEGPAEFCVQCGKELVSEYGDPEAE